jgi:hypothetical protein
VPERRRVPAVRRQSPDEPQIRGGRRSRAALRELPRRLKAQTRLWRIAWGVSAGVRRQTVRDRLDHLDHLARDFRIQVARLPVSDRKLASPAQSLWREQRRSAERKMPYKPAAVLFAASPYGAPAAREALESCWALEAQASTQRQLLELKMAPAPRERLPGAQLPQARRQPRQVLVARGRMAPRPLALWRQPVFQLREAAPHASGAPRAP